MEVLWWETCVPAIKDTACSIKFFTGITQARLLTESFLLLWLRGVQQWCGKVVGDTMIGARTLQYRSSGSW